MERKITFKEILEIKQKEYLKKTADFQKKKTILFCKSRECAEFKEFAKKQDIYWDEIIMMEDKEELKKEIVAKGRKFHCFISHSIMDDELYLHLKEEGIPEENIYIGPTSEQYFDLYEKRDVVWDNLESIEKVYNFLEDELSRKIFLALVTRLLVNYQFHYDYMVEDFPQYYPKDFNFSNEEIYLDAGVCDGQNIFEFIEATKGKYQHIYAFEADSTNYQHSLKNLEGVEKLSLFHTALHSKREDLFFLSSESTGKRGNAHVFPNGDIKVEGVPGDELEKVPTYIKMDIEGSEKDALIGLKESIRKCSPKLAICIYHFQKDFWEVPLLMKKLNPNYSLKIRNHEHLYTLLETVCYAYVKE